MNKRIKELAEQAGLEMCSCGCDMPTRQTIEFAKLIIEKCGEIAKTAEPWRSDDLLLKHFGVKE